MDISCDCYEKMIGVLHSTLVFDNQVTQARFRQMPKFELEEMAKRTAEELKKSINEAVSCGLNPFGLAPIVRGRELISLVDEVVFNYGERRMLDMLWDGLLDNLYSVKPCSSTQ